MLSTMGASKMREPLDYSTVPRFAREATVVEFDDRTEVHLASMRIVPAILLFCVLVLIAAWVAWAIFTLEEGWGLDVMWYRVATVIGILFAVSVAGRAFRVALEQRMVLSADAHGFRVRQWFGAESDEASSDWSEIESIRAVPGPLLFSLQRDNGLEFELADGAVFRTMHGRPITEIERVVAALLRWRPIVPVP